LYAEDFRTTYYAHGRLVPGCAFWKVDEDAKRGCEAVSGIGDGGRVVGNEGAQLRRGCFGLRKDV